MYKLFVDTDKKILLVEFYTQHEDGLIQTNELRLIREDAERLAKLLLDTSKTLHHSETKEVVP